MADPVKKEDKVPAPEAHAPSAPVHTAPKKDEPKKEAPKKEKYDNGFRGVSSQGAAIFAPGKHPKDRQLADKKAAEEAGA